MLVLIITTLYKMFENLKTQLSLNADVSKAGIDVSQTDVLERLLFDNYQ